MNLNKIVLNQVKNRFLSIPESASKGYEPEPKISDFELIKDLGVGSFGRVYLVSHKKTKCKYALKAIDKKNKSNIEEKPYFRREIEIMYRIHHPNVVKLYGHFEDDEYCYFIMQYIPKRSVFELITKEGQKPNLRLIASVMKDLLSAVYYLHNMKPTIMHRDIKPENILLDQNNKAYLTDFGWSNYKICERKKRKTICGTPLYLPPEMVGEFGHDETADIWCIGVLLFELITGKVPFNGNDFDTVKLNISRLNISWPSVMDPDAKDLASKILKLKGKDRLPIEDILGHKFFTKFFPNAVNELIKPDGQIPKVFVVSTDDPKNYGQPSKPASTYSKINKTNLSSYVNISISIKNNNSNVTPLINIRNNNYKRDKSNKKAEHNNRNKQSTIENARTYFTPKAKINLIESKKSETNNSFIKTTYTRYTSKDKDKNNTNTNKSNLNNSYSNIKYQNSPVKEIQRTNSFNANENICNKKSNNVPYKKSRFVNINIKQYDRNNPNNIYNSSNNNSKDYRKNNDINNNSYINSKKNLISNNKIFHPINILNSANKKNNY
jgi:serine/threonine protein kinase